MKTLHGVIQGQTIRLTAAPGFADGSEVEVAIRSVKPHPTWGAGLRRCAGALADIEGLDEDLEQIVAERQLAQFRELEE